MAFIATVADGDAEGDLEPLYEAALGRAGKVWNIVRMMSPNPAVLEASMNLYRAVMFGDSPLTRRQREMMATVVSASNSCHY